jgi:hypothetical protein
MKRVHLIARTFAPVSLFTILSPAGFRPPNANLPPGSAPAQESSGIVHFPNRERSWDKIPAIMVSTKENDPRIRLVHDAVDFWNKTFAELGAPFRLGPVAETGATLPAQFLATMSDAVLSRKPLPDPPETLRVMKGDLIVALSDGDFVSFSTGLREQAASSLASVAIGFRRSRFPTSRATSSPTSWATPSASATTTTRRNSCATAPPPAVRISSGPAWKNIFR